MRDDVIKALKKLPTNEKTQSVLAGDVHGHNLHFCVENEVTFFENRYRCKDGSYKWLAWHGTKADKNGLVTAIGSDISEQKEAEQHALILSQALEQSPLSVIITNTDAIIEYVNSSWLSARYGFTPIRNFTGVTAPSL